jgi:Nif-specific regulatory protein
LNVVSLTMPALRERREDIPALATWFMRKHRDKAKRPLSGFSAEAMACLTSYDWPGNVRELENAVERAVVLGSDSVVLPDDLPEDIAETAESRRTGGGLSGSGFHAAVKQAKRDLIRRAIEEAGGSVMQAARLLDLNPNYLHRLIKNLNLDQRRSKPGSSR